MSFLCSCRIPNTSLVCTFPVEYCEFGSHLTKCKEWLHETHADLYEKYYSEGTSTRTQLLLSHH